MNSVDPGNVETRIYRNFPFLSNPILYALQKPIRLLVMKTPWEGAQGILHALLAPSLSKTSGKYFRYFTLHAFRIVREPILKLFLNKQRYIYILLC